VKGELYENSLQARELRTDERFSGIKIRHLSSRNNSDTYMRISSRAYVRDGGARGGSYVC
jgi:hypothetical protein